MATISIYSVRDKVPGKVSVKINIRKGNQKKQIHQFNVDRKYWDEKRMMVKSSHPKEIELNSQLFEKVSSLKKRLKELETNDRSFEISDIISDRKKSVLLSEAIEAHVVNLNAPTARRYRNVKSHVEKFNDAPIAHVNITYMKQFEKYLREKNLAPVTIHRYLGFLKTAIRAQRKIGNFSDEYVLDYSVKASHVKKDHLTFEEFDRWNSVEKLPLYRDLFSACVYTRGTRIGDILQLREENINDDRLEFTEQKTQKLKSIYLFPELLKIINRYSDRRHYGYLFPMLDYDWVNPRKHYWFHRHIQSKTTIINRKLKIVAAHAGVDKKITTHVARHTFTWMADKSNLNSRDIQKMMNFSSLQIMENYISEIRNDKHLDDEALRIFNQNDGEKRK